VVFCARHGDSSYVKLGENLAAYSCDVFTISPTPDEKRIVNIVNMTTGDVRAVKVPYAVSLSITDAAQELVTATPLQSTLGFMITTSP
jgi:hypothetical protein